MNIGARTVWSQIDVCQASSCGTLSASISSCFLPMISSVELSELLATLYAAPLQPEKWQVFFNRLCGLTNIASGYMFSVHPQLGSSILAGGGLNFDPETLSLYNLHYHAKDPYLIPGLANRRIGVIQGEELVGRSELLRSELYNEVLLPHNLSHMTLLDCSTETSNLFPLWSSPQQGPLNPSSIQLLQMLLPHMQTSLRLRTHISAFAMSTLFLEMALESMSFAAILVQSTGHIQYLNRRAAQHVEQADGLCLNNSKLAAVDPQEDTKLGLLIRRATEKSKNDSHAAPGGAMKVTRRRSDFPLHLTILPIPEGLKRIEPTPCALVFIYDPLASPKSRATFMRQLYALTPAESRLADLLLEGEEVRVAAERLGITTETARFHLKRVLAKTQTGRQTELMRLMLSLPGDPQLYLSPPRRDT